MSFDAEITALQVDQSFIAGHWCVPVLDKGFDLFDPASETAVGRAHLCGITELDRAVQAAQAVLKNGWGRQDIANRLVYLDRLIEALDRNRLLLARSISAEVGSPIDFALAQQVGTAIGHLQATQAAAQTISQDRTPDPAKPTHRERYEPVGVAAMITPWNWPLNQIALKFGAALVAGCPMILKPSEYTPRTSVLFARCVQEIGLPHGTFNMLLGGAELGAAMSSHQGIDLVSFTGSTDVGRKISLAAAPDFKRCILELGGKSPNILFENCQVETAVQQGLAHCFRNAGQSCNAASLMLVQDGIYDQVLVLAKQDADRTRMGPPSENGSHLGPVISKAQYDRVQVLIQSGIDQGARLIAGGLGRADGFKQGFYVRPTVFADVTPDMRIAKEEIFGPVQSIMKFSHEKQAVDYVNSQDHGLAAYIQSSDDEQADRVSQQLNVGLIQINGTSRLPGAPFGGTRQSGIGRESGIWGIRAYQEVKSISGVARQV